MVSIVLGSFFGDEGKGQCVHNLCMKSLSNGKNPLVVRFSGGHQVGHNVAHENLKHCFSNFGSGTLLGVPTYWSEYCTVDPITTIAEAKVLSNIGVSPKIAYSPFCQIVVPFDVYAQWNNEDNRKHGTVGTGFKPCLDRVKSGYGITMADARNPLILREKLYAIMNYYYKVDSNMPMFDLDNWVRVVSTFAKQVRLEHFDTVKLRFKDLIFEGSQGILLDQRFGIMPYCTPSNTTCQNAMEMIKDATNVVHYYVCRPYITRHGNGPLCNTEKVITVKDENNQYNEFQQTMRGSEFSVELLQHSVYIDSLFHNPNKWSNKVLVFSHANEVTTEIYESVARTALFSDIHGFEYETNIYLRR